VRVRVRDSKDAVMESGPAGKWLRLIRANLV
jgi:hypothetical protein